LGEAETIAKSLMQRGVIAHDQGDYITARLHLEEGVAIWRKSNAYALIGAGEPPGTNAQQEIR
jgi:hypothetical protein